MQASKPTLKELQYLIKKMTINTIQRIVLPEFGMDWKKVAHTVAVTNQPLNSDSVARVLCKVAAITIPRANIEDILGRLKFIVVAKQTRTWHVVRMLPITDPTTEKQPLITALNLPHRIANNNTHKTEVEALLVGNLLHFSVRMKHLEGHDNLELDGCLIPGDPVALFSSLNEYQEVQRCVEALGYGSYVDLKLKGQNIASLLCKAYEHEPPEPECLPVLSHSVTDENPALKPKPQLKPQLSMIEEESFQDSDEERKEEPISSMWPGPCGDRYVERRCEACQYGRFDRTLMETTINLTIDSD